MLLNTTPAGATTLRFSPQQTFATGPDPESVAVGDFNGDGKPDLAVGDADSRYVSVLINTTRRRSGHAQLRRPSGPSAVEGDAISIAVGDFNGDGKPDLAVADGNFLDVSVLINTTAAGSTTPSFATQQPFDVEGDPFSVAVGDFNGDGKPDLAVAKFGDNTVSVLLNTSPQDKSPAQASSPTAAYLRDAFERLTGRPLSDSRLEALLRLVSAHPGPRRSTLLRPTFTRLARALLRSPEFREREVRNLYRACSAAPSPPPSSRAGSPP